MKKLAWFRFCGGLASLAPRGGGETDSVYRFTGSPALKDAIEAQGVPHTEVDILVVDGRSVDFGHRLQAGQHIEVYPFDLAPAITPLHPLLPPVPGDPRFILDVHLGKLARRLRLLGFDCSYRNDLADAEIVRLALQEGRIILTRDRGILKQAAVGQGYLLRSAQPLEQVREVVVRYRLARLIQPLQRCPVCNGLLEVVAKSSIRHRLLPKTERYYQDFQRCRRCDKLYWRGSHYAKIGRWIEQLRKGPDA